MFKSLFQPASRSQFAKLIARELRQVGDKRAAHYRADTFQLRFTENGEDVGVANLHNIYDEYSHRSGRDRKEYLKQAVRTLLSPYKKLPDEFVDARSDLMLTVRERSYFTLLEARNWAQGNKQFKWPHLPIGTHLAVGLVYDLPEAMVMLQQQQLDEWNISFYEAYEVAFGNLTECEATFSAFDDRLYVADTQDNYDASRILMADWICGLAVQGNPIAMVPNRDKLLITGSDDERGLQMMAAMARDILQLPRPMSGMAFEYSDNDWAPWVPSRDHSVFAPFQQMQSETLVDICNQQEAVFAEVGPDNSRGAIPKCARLRVAQCGAAGEAVTYCVWRQGDAWLLPKADYVVFQPTSSVSSEDRRNRFGRWDDVFEVVGELMEHETEMYPDRFHVDGFPSTEQLVQMSCNDALSFKEMC